MAGADKVTDNMIEAAAVYATQSAYATDIEAGGGLVFDKAVVESWKDFKLWFSMPRSHQMVGVRMVNGRPTCTAITREASSRHRTKVLQ
jgi:hypothetical protein